MIKKYLLSLLVMILLVVTTLSIIINNEHNKRLDDISIKSENTLSIESQKIHFTLNDIVSDLKYLSKNFNNHTMKQVNNDFLNFSAQKRKYDQIRYIDLNGFEKIRIDFKNGKAHKVKKNRLQNKKNRYYFLNTITLDKNTIYISPLDLNIENGAIEVPIKPMIRFSTTIYNKKNEKTGIIILNYLADEILREIKNTNNNFIGDICLLNNDGYYFISQESSNEWGFMFPKKNNSNFKDNNKKIWDTINLKNMGKVKTKGEVYFYKTINISKIQGKDDIICDSCSWKMIIHIPDSYFDDEIIKSLSSYIPVIIFVIVLLAIFLWFFIMNYEQRQKNDQEIVKLSKQIMDERDIFVSGPTVVFKLKNAYGWPVEYVSQNVKDILGYDADEFLNGNINYSNIINPEFINRYSESVATAKRNNIKWFEHEPYKVSHKSGHHIWLSDSISIIKDKDNNITHLYGYMTDITDLKNAQKAMEDNSIYIKTVLDTIADPTIVIDINSYEVVLYNKSAKELYLGKNYVPSLIKCHQMSHSSNIPCEGKNDPCPITEILTTKKKTKVIHKHFRENGSEIYVELIAIPILDKDDNVTQIIESHRDITYHIDKENSLKKLASMDKLTQTFNRSKFDDVLESCFLKAQNDLDYFGLVMFDIDHFKNVNDTYGHDVGDSVLVEISALIKERIRADDILVRWGGEEFMVYISNATQTSLETISEHLRSSVENYKFKHVNSITASFGATMLKSDDDIESLVKRVDTALYTSKHNGRNMTTVL